MNAKGIIQWLRLLMQQQVPQTLDGAHISVQGVPTPNLIRLLEELSLNAWPSLQTIHYDGWALRFANGYTRRANSINPLFSSSLNLDDKIRYCEGLFEARGMKPVFKMTPQVQPENLDNVLAKKWYREEAPTSVQILDLEGLEQPNIKTVTISETLTDSWLKAYCRMNRVPEQHVATLTQLLNNIVPRHCFMTLLQDGEAVAAGMGVVDRGYMGLFDIVTDEPQRQRGYGRQLMLNLLNWGKHNGAEQAYLQVMASNAAAQHLYWKLGFREVYQYWYRVKGNR
jgi:GNAT superfamily N-acetyltransferase